MGQNVLYDQLILKEKKDQMKGVYRRAKHMYLVLEV